MVDLPLTKGLRYGSFGLSWATPKTGGLNGESVWSERIARALAVYRRH